MPDKKAKKQSTPIGEAERAAIHVLARAGWCLACIADATRRARLGPRRILSSSKVLLPEEHAPGDPCSSRLPDWTPERAAAPEKGALSAPALPYAPSSALAGRTPAHQRSVHAAHVDLVQRLRRRITTIAGRLGADAPKPGAISGAPGQAQQLAAAVERLIGLERRLVGLDDTSDRLAVRVLALVAKVGSTEADDGAAWSAMARAVAAGDRLAVLPVGLTTPAPAAEYHDVDDGQDDDQDGIQASGWPADGAGAWSEGGEAAEGGGRGSPGACLAP